MTPFTHNSLSHPHDFTLMKAGRPSYHVPSKWVTVFSNNGLLYFELDKKGNIVKPPGGKIIPHHMVPIAPPVQPIEQPVQPIERPALVQPEIPVNAVPRSPPSSFLEFEPMDDLFSQDWPLQEESLFDFP